MLYLLFFVYILFVYFCLFILPMTFALFLYNAFCFFWLLTHSLLITVISLHHVLFNQLVFLIFLFGLFLLVKALCALWTNIAYK